MPGTLAETSGPIPTTERLRTSRKSHLRQERTLVIVSNRGPYEHHLDENGKLKAVRGQGGVITALSAIAESQRVQWVAAALTETDRRIASGELSLQAPSEGDSRLGLRLVPIEPSVYQKYYNTFSNPFLWFLQHQMECAGTWTHTLEEAWHTGYVPANRAMAHAAWSATRHLGTVPVIMLHDYHLYLAAGYLRSLLPHAVIQHFVHIPWPRPSTWRHLTPPVRSMILDGLLANDIVGLHTQRDVRNFLDSVRSLVLGAVVDPAHSTVHYRGRATHVRAYPISVDVPRLRRELRSSNVRSYAERLAPLAGERTIVRVDRLDPTKNVVRGFEAFDLLLQRRPDLHGKVRFLSFLVPSRTSIPVYQDYEQQVLAAARDLNQQYGTATWQPIEVFHENNYHQSLAAMQLYDVLLVNPVADGMNLVSKEGSVVNERDGVLVLSKSAGSYEQLSVGALGIDPLDPQQTARALERALDMPHTERHARAELLRCAVESEDLSCWLDSQLADIDALVQPYKKTCPQGHIPNMGSECGCTSSSSLAEPSPTCRGRYAGTCTAGCA